jgi:hypothetical protein
MFQVVPAIQRQVPGHQSGYSWATRLEARRRRQLRAGRFTMLWPFGALEKRRRAFAELFTNPNFPPSWPYTASDFERLDESPDELFYTQPRFVTHIDDDAIAALKSFYGETLRDGTDLLDLCSSWISHLPEQYRPRQVVGLGLNDLELKKNTRLDRWVVQNLNENPVFPFADDMRGIRRLPDQAVTSISQNTTGTSSRRNGHHCPVKSMFYAESDCDLAFHE